MSVTKVIADMIIVFHRFGLLAPYRDSFGSDIPDSFDAGPDISSESSELPQRSLPDAFLALSRVEGLFGTVTKVVAP